MLAGAAYYTLPAMHSKILILDFGSQVTQLIARRVRELNVYCEIHPSEMSDEAVREFGASGIILGGSHMSAYQESTSRAPEAVFSAGVPVLGICYGMQTMAQQLGGRVEAGTTREFGFATGAGPWPHAACWMVSRIKRAPAARATWKCG